MSRDSAPVRLLPEAVLLWRRDGRFEPPASWPSALREGVRRWPLGDSGALFLAADGLDTSESPEALIARFGGLRSPGGTPLDAHELRVRGLASAERIDGGSLTGNGLALAVDLRAPRFAAYSTFFAVPQLYYAELAGGFVAASEPRLLLPLLDRVEIDAESLPSYFLFRCVTDRSTHFTGVRRLYPGELLTVDAGEVRLRRLRTLRDVASTVPRFAAVDDAGIDWLDGVMAGLTGSWVAASRQTGREVGNLLSGGLDSSLAQAWLNDLRPAVERRSWSFDVPVPSFAFEVRYAREASELFGTRHRFVRVEESEYLDLFDRAVDRLAEPTLYNEGWACLLAVAEELAADASAPRSLFAGNGADALHGVGDLKAVVRWLALRRRPERLAALRAALPRLRERPGSAVWVEAVEMEGGLESFADPSSVVGIAGEPSIAVAAFGEAAVRRAFDARREIEQELFGSADLFERLQLLDLVSAAYGQTIAMARLFAGSGIDVVQIYLDEAAIAAPFAFPAELRYLRPAGPWRQRLKPLQQEMLKRRGLGALVGRKKGGTAFNADLWRWLSSGILRERVEAMERPAWMSAREFEAVKGRWSDFLWNLLVYDTWKRRVVDPASRKEGER